MFIFRSKLISIIYSHVDTENNIVAWCLLVSFSQFMDLPNPNQIYEYYERILPDMVGIKVRIKIFVFLN